MTPPDWQKIALETLRNAGAFASDQARPTLRLGVTGFARSGKTVLITALIHNLLHGGLLSHFSAMREGKIRAVRLEPHPDRSIAAFDYEGHIEALTADPPRWPESTKAISQVRLVIEFEPPGFFANMAGSGSLNLDIVDYPGEWLLDLALLDQNFAQWSGATLALLREPSREQLARPFLEFISKLDPSAAFDERTAKAGHRLYRDYLALARQKTHTLSLLTPGRFLLPGELEGTPLMTFFPLEASTGSLAPELSLRFETFRKSVVRQFYSRHFGILDRQIVLVDALDVLNAGPDAVADLKRALDAVLASFRAGRNSWLSALFYRRIDRVLFAATKADHLHHQSRPRLEAILGTLVEEALARGRAMDAEVRTLAIASLRATEEAAAKDKALPEGFVLGIPLAGQMIDGRTTDGISRLAVHPGELPDNPAEALQRAETGGPLLDLNFVKFGPPRLELNAAGVPARWPHIDLDRVLEILLGDRLG